jgi:proton-translocating NADH-quinone oxidoreductase chain M
MVDSSSYFLVAATFLPLIVSPVAYFIGKQKGINIATWFSFGILAISSVLLIVPTLNLGSGGAYQETLTWGQLGNFGLRLDGLSIPFALTIYILSTIVVLYSKPYMVRKILNDYDNVKNEFGSHEPNAFTEGERPRTNFEMSTLVLTNDQKGYLNHQMGVYFALYLAFSMGMLGTVLATNLVEFYVFFELMLVPSFFLIAFFGYSKRKRVSLMFFFWAHVGAIVLLLSLLTMGFFAGGFDYDVVKQNISKIPVSWMGLIVFGIVAGFTVKLGALLVHIWLPDTYTVAPTPISVIISSVMTGIGAYGLVRIWVELFSVSYSDYSFYISLWGAASMIYGGAMALMQKDIKRVLAYSSISSMGYILFGIGSESVLGLSGAIMMYVTHALGKSLLFMMAGSIILQTGTSNMNKLGGLGSKMPYTAVLAMIGCLTIIGVPITSGFMSEWVLFNGALQSAVNELSVPRVVTFAFAILSTILTSAYLLWMYKRIFYGEAPQPLKNVHDSSRYVIVTMGVIAALTLIIGLYPDLFYKPIIGYADTLYGSSDEVAKLPQKANSSAITPVSENKIIDSADGKMSYKIRLTDANYPQKGNF